MSVLCDTICVWALYFRDSAYRRHVLNLRSKYGLIIPDICFLEASYPIYRAKGIEELGKYSKFIENLPLSKNIEILKTGMEDLQEALKIAAEEPENFIDEENNLCLFDALIASIWARTRMTLASRDPKLKNFGKKKRLQYIQLIKSKKRKHKL